MQSQVSDFLVNSFGVPQGSIPGPILFLLFINDVVNCASRDGVVNLFADDMLYTASGKTPEEVKLKLERCLVKLSSWYENNRLKLHPKKTKFMIVGTKNQIDSTLSELPNL